MLIEERGKDAVIRYLELLANGIEQQDETSIYSFYSIAHNQLETQEERKAFKYGTLAVLAEVGKLRIRSLLYRRKFRKLMTDI